MYNGLLLLVYCISCRGHSTHGILLDLLFTHLFQVLSGSRWLAQCVFTGCCATLKAKLGHLTSVVQYVYLELSHNIQRTLTKSLYSTYARSYSASFSIFYHFHPLIL